MKRLATLFLFVTLCVSSEKKVTQFVMPSHVLAEQQSPDIVNQYQQGRKIFVSRCAKCHDEDAAKKLPDGTSLVQRLADSKDPEALAGTRLKRMSEEEREAVRAYLHELIKHYRSSKPSNSQSKSLADPSTRAAGLLGTRMILDRSSRANTQTSWAFQRIRYKM